VKPPAKHILKLADGREEPIKDLDGASRTILVDEQTVDAEDITFGHSRFAPRTSIHRKHRHPNAEEIMYILSGRGVAGVGGEEAVVVAGDTIWVPRGEVHWFSNPYDEPCEFVFIYTRSSLAKAAYEMAGLEAGGG
jgi:quercetin dioxygenase-like cupin family protein